MNDSTREEVQEKIRRLEQDALDLKRKLLHQENLEEQLIQAQKMESLANLAAGIAHDFNNILQSILGHTQLALFRKKQGDPDLDTFQQIEKMVERGRELTEQFLTMGRKKLPSFAPLDLNRRVRDTAKLLRRTIPKMIDIELVLSQDLKSIQGDDGQIDQVLMNLSLNARDSMAKGGGLTFKTESVLLDADHTPLGPNVPPGDYTSLSVSDTGCGISENAMKRMYEPFFTTKSGGKGTGLGLAIVYAIVKNHGGWLQCESRVGKGTTFTLYFPALSTSARQEPDPQPLAASSNRSGNGNETLLLVEDDVDILKPMGKILQKHGYRVVSAESGEEAVEKYSPDEVDLVVLDVSMPGMGGERCMEELLNLDSTAKVIISTGYPADTPVVRGLKAQAKGFLPKPYAIHALLKMVRITLDRPGLD